MRFWIAGTLLGWFVLYLYQDRVVSKKKGKIVGNVRKVRAYYCPYCEYVFAHETRMCVECDAELEMLEFDRIADLNNYIKQIDQEQLARSLTTRMPGMRFTSTEQDLFAQFEKRNDCILYACTSKHIIALAPEPVQPSSQAGIEINRLQFARYLRVTGRISEMIEEEAS